MRERLNVEWTVSANKDFDKIYNFILERWPESVADRFVEDVRRFTDLVSVYPYLYNVSSYRKKFRKAAINMHVTIIYSIRKNSILIHLLIDNRSSSPR